MPGRQYKSTLVTRNIYVGEHRTSIRLETAFWDMLDQVSAREGITVNDVCTRIGTRAMHHSLTSAIRVFLLSYAWSANMESALATVPAGHLPELP